MTNGQWPNYQPYPPQGSPYGPPPKQQGSGLGWLALAVAVILAVGVGAFFFLTRDANTAATTSTTPPTPEPATSSSTPVLTTSMSPTPTVEPSPTPSESPTPSAEPTPSAPTDSGVRVPEMPKSFGAFSAVTTLTPEKGTWADSEGVSFTVSFAPNRTWNEDVLWDEYTQIRELGEYWCAIPKDAEVKKNLNAICLTNIHGGFLFTSMDGSHMSGDKVIVDKVIDRDTVLEVTKQFVVAWQPGTQDG